MTAAPALEQVESLPLYQLSSYTEAGLGEGFWAGYRPGRPDSFDPAGGLEAAWRDPGGLYLLLGERLLGEDAFTHFSQGIESILPGLAVDARILWIENPLDLPGNWQLQLVQARASGSGAQISWRLSRSATLSVGQYGVTLPAGAPLTQADPTATGYGIAVGGEGLGFEGPRGGYGAAPASSWLPLAGPFVGAWRARLQLPASVGDGMRGLGVALRYAAPRKDGKPGDGVDVLGMSLLAQDVAVGDLTLRLAFDPLHPLAPERTRLGFFDDDGGGGAVEKLPATLRTSRGYGTSLQPLSIGDPLRPARLVLCKTPLTVAGKKTRAVPLSYHLAPDGAFELTVQPPLGAEDAQASEHHRLMLGLSGLEYVAIDLATGAKVFFAAGRAALAPSAAPEAPATDPGKTTPLSMDATTAHLAVLPPREGAPGLTYYAQPRQAPLYSRGGSGNDLGPGILEFLEVAAKTLPRWSKAAGEPPTFPAGAMAGAARASSALAKRLEHAALAPARRQAIGISSADLTLVDEWTPAVTPQGLMVEVDSHELKRVVVANMPETPQGKLGFAPVGDRFRAAVQSNELFFVVGDPAKLMEDSSVPFHLNATGLRLAEAKLSEPVAGALRSHLPVSGADAAAFEGELERLAPGITTEEKVTLEGVAGFLEAVLSDWTFQLSPPSWRTGEAPTLMIFKYGNRSLAALAEDGAAWGWQEAAGPATAKELRRVIAAAKERADDGTVPHDDPYKSFYREVVANPSWNGVLFLNAPVSIAELPSELQFISAGIDPKRFYAHHVGFSATPVKLDEGGAIALKQTAAFGLIDYRDPVDLKLDPKNPNPDFRFKTLSLTARFANAALVDFSARVELMVNELLGAPLTKVDPTHGNNLMLTGSMQRHGNACSYAFVLEGEHVYSTDRTALESVQVDSVKVVTTAGVDKTGHVVTSFVLGGWLRFVNQAEFDVFSYGGAAGEPPFDGRLRFDGLRVGMSFPLAEPSQQEFTAAIDGVRLDPLHSAPRPRSLIGNFPVTLTGLVGSTSQTPQESGYAPVAAPIDQLPVSPPWYGLAYELDLGTLGALAGATGLSLKLLAAWGKASKAGSQPVFVGLELPAGMSWTLQSVIKLGFRSFEFDTFEEGPSLAYVLRLRRFALSLLGISLPQGNLDLTLFGDPGDPTSRVVGWYAAYQEKSGALTERAEVRV